MNENMVCCPLSGVDGESPSFFSDKIVKAKKEHRCSECKEAIPIKTQYEYASGCWDGDFQVYKTCMSCVEIRAHFACGNGWTYGYLWNDLEENFFPDMKAGGPCMEGLSPEAKARLFELRLKWLENNNE